MSSSVVRKSPKPRRSATAAEDSDLARFRNLDYEGFRELARDPSLDRWQKIGFPTTYRRGLENTILQDIRSKLRALDRKSKRVLDIGAGCGDLPRLLAEHCRVRKHELTLLDSREMLDLLPKTLKCRKAHGRFPDEPIGFVAQERERFDAILCYSVFQYAVSEGAWTKFLDSALGLLRPGGDLLIGDVPNRSKRRRFFASEAGVAFHRAFMKTSGLPEADAGSAAPGEIDDSVVFEVLRRCRAFGFDAYVVPQDDRLSMANRREDILIRRP